MIRFDCDYNEGAAPEILEILSETNFEQTCGYGEDGYSDKARDLIRRECAMSEEEADVHFMVGGTIANLTVIASALRPHQGVLSASTGHINRHETGAIEACGHKILVLPSADGKIHADQVDEYCYSHFSDSFREHEVQPGMVYISMPTELGTIYSRSELEALRKVCDKYDLYLFMDGARLGYGLAAEGCDLDMPSIARLCDVFYIGGTKQGMLFGEAIVITRDSIKKDFRYIIKQKGGMLAKGRLLALQFIVMFEDGLYARLSERAARLAMKLRDGFRDAGFEFLIESPTNQQFPILPDAMAERISEDFVYSYEERIDEEHSAVRFCTSWATKEEHLDLLLERIRREVERGQD